MKIVGKKKMRVGNIETVLPIADSQEADARIQKKVDGINSEVRRTRAAAILTIRKNKKRIRFRSTIYF